MKNAILLMFIAGAINVYGQKKMTGTSSYYYDNTGAVQYIDSNAYQYATSEGSLTSNEPTFEFADAIYDWLTKAPFLLCNQEYHFSGASLPLTADDTTINTLSGGNVIQKESSIDRAIYTYDANGNMLSEASYYFDGISWVQSEEQLYEYDANQNLLVRNYYDYSSGSSVHMETDTMDYNGANQLISSINYTYDDVSLQWYPYYKSLLSYTGNELSLLALFEGDLVTPLEQIYDVEYTFVGGKPEMFEAFEYIGGVPQTPAVVVYDYTYGTNQKLSKKEVSFSGSMAQKIEYSYDSEGFLTQVSTSEFDFSTGMFYVYLNENYYYTSTADLNENQLSSISVYPNPVEDLLMISTEETIENVKIVGVNGKLMIEQNSNAIDVSVLPSGVYIAQIKTAAGFSQARFVKN